MASQISKYSVKLTMDVYDGMVSDSGTEYREQVNDALQTDMRGVLRHLEEAGVRPRDSVQFVRLSIYNSDLEKLAQCEEATGLPIPLLLDMALRCRQRRLAKDKLSETSPA